MNHQHSTPPKQRLLDAATLLFAQKGYSATGVREIAQRAEVNIAMISYYFGSKRGLLETLLDMFFQRYREMVEQVMSGKDTPEQKIRQLIRALVSSFRDNPDLVRVAFTEMPFDLPDITAFRAGHLRQIVDLGQSELLPMLQEDLSHPIRPEIFGPAMVGTVAFHFLLRPVIEAVFNRATDDAFYAEYPEAIADLFLYGVLGKRPSED